MRKVILITGLALSFSGCVASPPPPVISQVVTATPPDNLLCRDYTAQATIQDKPQTIVGHACQQPDGTWRIVESLQGQAGQYDTVYVPPPDVYYSGYDPWLWEPPIEVSVGAFVFVDHDHHFRDVHHRLASMRFHDGIGHWFRTSGIGRRRG